jgi:hypothetical protein
MIASNPDEFMYFFATDFIALLMLLIEKIDPNCKTFLRIETPQISLCHATRGKIGANTQYNSTVS